MSEQKSQKQDGPSGAQKRATSHREYDEMPGSGQKADAVGKQKRDRHSDKNVAGGIDDSRREQRKKQLSELERSEDV
jgi:hypothetical protein